MEPENEPETVKPSAWRRTCPLFVSAFLAIAIPDALLVTFLTAVGFGPEVYNRVASIDVSWASNAAACFSAFWLALLFVLDLSSRGPCLQIPLGFVLVVCSLATATLKAISYPWAVHLLCLCLSILLLGYLRVYVFSAAHGIPVSFFLILTSICFVVCAMLVLGLWIGVMAAAGRLSIGDETNKAWLASKNADVYAYLSRNWSFALNYDSHCGISQDLSDLSEDDTAMVSGACTDAEEVWFLQWSGPLLAVVCNTLAAVFCGMFARMHPKMVLMSEADQMTQMKALLRDSVLSLALTLAMMYASVAVSGASVSLGSAMMCLGAVSTAVILGYTYLEVDHALLRRLAAESSLSRNILKITKSDWVRAMVVGGMNVLLPTMAVLDMARQKVRRRTGLADATDNDKFTTGGRRIVDELKTWNWVSICKKVVLLGQVFVMLMLGTKLTFVCFSWLNLELAAANLNFEVVAVMVFVIGLAMFMNPAVPGSAVYLFAGVVLGAQAQLPGAVGFWPGVAVACAVSSIAKLAATTGQYALGYAAGKSVKVQKFVGVDTINTRAMEKILKLRGLSLGKVSILVAGPDFPTSMLCGILKLHVPSMLLGTTPVILVSIVPQVLVGALLTLDGGDTGMWPTVSAGVTGAAAAFQAGATMIFTYRIMKTVEQDGEELAKPREEHAAVAELTKKESAFVEVYSEISRWTVLSRGQTALILSSACLILGAGFTIAADNILSEAICFRSFSITNRIADPYELGGLNGSVVNLVLVPMGWVALGIALIATVLDVISGKWLKAAARRHLKDRAQTELVRTIGKPVDGELEHEPAIEVAQMEGTSRLTTDAEPFAAPSAVDEKPLAIQNGIGERDVEEKTATKAKKKVKATKAMKGDPVLKGEDTQIPGGSHQKGKEVLSNPGGASKEKKGVLATVLFNSAEKTLQEKSANHRNDQEIGMPRVQKQGPAEQAKPGISAAVADPTSAIQPLTEVTSGKNRHRQPRPPEATVAAAGLEGSLTVEPVETSSGYTHRHVQPYEASVAAIGPEGRAVEQDGQVKRSSHKHRRRHGNKRSEASVGSEGLAVEPVEKSSGHKHRHRPAQEASMDAIGSEGLTAEPVEKSSGDKHRRRHGNKSNEAPVGSEGITVEPVEKSSGHKHRHRPAQEASMDAIGSEGLTAEPVEKSSSHKHRRGHGNKSSEAAVGSEGIAVEPVEKSSGHKHRHRPAQEASMDAMGSEGLTAEPVEKSSGDKHRRRHGNKSSEAAVGSEGSVVEPGEKSSSHKHRHRRAREAGAVAIGSEG